MLGQGVKRYGAPVIAGYMNNIVTIYMYMGQTKIQICHDLLACPNNRSKWVQRCSVANILKNILSVLWKEECH